MFGVTSPAHITNFGKAGLRCVGEIIGYLTGVLLAWADEDPLERKAWSERVGVRGSADQWWRTRVCRLGLRKADLRLFYSSALIFGKGF